MKIRWKTLLPALALPLAVGGLSAWLTRKGMALYETVDRPPLSPPRWVFPVAWTALYLLMGAASWLVWESPAGEDRERALRLYGTQLAVNFLWPVLFFGFGWYFVSLLWLALLWLLALRMTRSFRALDSRAGAMTAPYVAWLTFAAYLNLGVWLLNR